MIRGMMGFFGFGNRNGRIFVSNDEDQQSTLCLAAKNGDERVVRRLLEEGADVSSVDKNGCTALHVAARNGHGQVVSQLIQAGVNVNYVHKNGFSALHVAAIKGHDRIVEQLLEYRAQLMIEYDLELSSLKSEKMNNVIECSNGLMNQINEDKPNLRSINSMLEQEDVRLSINLVRVVGGCFRSKERSPLMVASEKGHAQVVEMLINAGSDVNVKNCKGKSAFDYAKSDEVRQSLSTSLQQDNEMPCQSPSRAGVNDQSSLNQNKSETVRL